MFSIITPLDSNRLEQFKVTKELYDEFPQKKEFLIPTREYAKVRKYLVKNDLLKDVTLLPYKTDEGFNPSMALNIGTRAANYNNLIITSPEVMPMTRVLDQLEELLGKNVICQVHDEDERGEVTISLVNTNYRQESPAMYFLAMFNKADVEALNGWDEEFMKGYAYEDNDFGDRFNRAGLKFIIREDIMGRHQYHPRSETVPGGLGVNYNLWQANTVTGVIRPSKGLIVE